MWKQFLTKVYIFLFVLKTKENQKVIESALYVTLVIYFLSVGNKKPLLRQAHGVQL